MQNNKVNQDFLKMAVQEKIRFGKRISSCMRNAIEIFRFPRVEIFELDTILSNLEYSRLQGNDVNDSFQMALLLQEEAQLDKTLSLLARYVDRTANGNKYIVLKSGFLLKSEVRGPNSFRVFNINRMLVQR